MACLWCRCAVVALAACCWSTVAAAQDQPACLDCHGAVVGGHVQHAVVQAGICTACHVENTGDTTARAGRPHKGFTLAASGGALCSDCHPGPTAQAPQSHPPAQVGLCTDCHDPHSSNNRTLLKAALPELCYTCHEPVRDSVRVARVSHRALYVEASCANCHAPHTAPQPHLLRAPLDSLCLSCHDREYPSPRGRLTAVAAQIRSARYVHPPVAAGLCTACHSPHGSLRDRLLNAGYELQVYAEFRPSTFALCAGCHEAAAFSDTVTEATGFRAGRRNLHAVHLREPGRNRTCHLCHDPHSADNPKLVRASVGFGAWMLPIGFRPTDRGGSCAPGCHEPRGYDRSAADSTAGGAARRGP